MFEYKKYFLLVVCLTIVSVGYAQRADSINILAKAKTNKIMLRWYPNNEVIWEQGLKYGYRIERKTTHRNNVPVNENFTAVTGASVVKSWIENDFRNWLDQYKYLKDGEYTTDSIYHLITAQTLYVNENNMSAEAKKELEELPKDNPDNPTSALKSRFDYCMLGTVISYSAAKMAGLGFDDKTVNANEKYIYRIALVNPLPDVNVFYEQTPIVELAANDLLPFLPKPKLKFEDKSAYLQWNTDTIGLKEAYIGYYLERSTDEVNYSRLMKQILIKGSQEPRDSLGNSIPDNSIHLAHKDKDIKHRQWYCYKLVAKTIFDEMQYAEPVCGMSINTYYPSIKYTDMVSKNSLKVDWKFTPVVGDSLYTVDPSEYIPIKKFMIERGSNSSEFSVIKDDISPNDTTTIITFLENGNINPESAHYIRVVAIPDVENVDNLVSHSLLVQPIDSVAPFIPKVIKVEVLEKLKETAILRIHYAPDARDRDIEGYHIFRSDNLDDEHLQRTNDITTLTSFVDTIALKLLNDKVFYKVIAVDKRGNRSDLSPSFAFDRPDIIPPSEPIVELIRSSDDGMKISFVNAQDKSGEVIKHTVLRKQLPFESSWTILSNNIVATKDTAFVDNTAVAGKRYAYVVVATDPNGNQSFSNPMIADIPFGISYNSKITSFKASINRTNKTIDLSWKIKGDNFAHFQIFKSEGNGELISWGAPDGDSFEISDFDIQNSTVFNYAIRGVLKDGTFTNWTNTFATYPDECNTIQLLQKNTPILQDTEVEACDTIELKPGFDTKNNQKKFKFKTKLEGQN